MNAPKKQPIFLRVSQLVDNVGDELHGIVELDLLIWMDCVLLY